MEILALYSLDFRHCSMDLIAIFKSDDALYKWMNKNITADCQYDYLVTVKWNGSDFEVVSNSFDYFDD